MNLYGHGYDDRHLRDVHDCAGQIHTGGLHSLAHTSLSCLSATITLSTTVISSSLNRADAIVSRSAAASELSEGLRAAKAGMARPGYEARPSGSAAHREGHLACV